MFAILFGLSMDYQVFLVSRIGEVWTRDRRQPRPPWSHGLASSARVITSAALIMVAVFASFILNGDPTVKQFGVGLAVAIAVDATIVRCLLVPAAMVILGKANWWLPRLAGADHPAGRPRDRGRAAEARTEHVRQGRRRRRGKARRRRAGVLAGDEQLRQ